MRRKVLEPVVPVLFKWLSYTVSSIAAKVGDIEVWCSEEYRGDGERKGIFFRCIVEQEEINVQGLQTTWATEESPELDTKDTIRLANRLLEALRKLSEGVLVHLEREEFMTIGAPDLDDACAGSCHISQKFLSNLGPLITKAWKANMPIFAKKK
ncbi:MAG: hypothetical protein LQ351_006675 [Letrouitia transgressa]|nr:MAG: hypothetical protein LQ351_006675 [Letrouitia transgressa]